MVKRGEIYFTTLGDGVGSEQSGRRPVIIVQNNIGNMYSGTVIVIPVTSASTAPPTSGITTFIRLKTECASLINRYLK